MITKSKIIIISIFFLFPLGLTNRAFAATEFISIVDTGGASDSDYSSLSTWETGLGTNLTAPSTLVFSGVITGTAPIDNSSVTLYRSGSPVGVGATVVHTAKTGTQILLENVTNPSYGFTTGDEWRIDASNLFTIDATTPDQPQVTAKCRATTGAADTTAVTVDGWDTDATHYIKIWADPNENYRHQGKWDVSKYRLEITSNSYPINISEEYATVDGLQIKLTQVNMNSAVGIYASAAGTGTVNISNNIVAGVITGTSNGVFGILNTGNANLTAKIYNNIVYGFANGANTEIGISLGAGTSYVYNNTVTNSYIGIHRNAGTLIAKNNISYNNADNYSGGFDASGTNNLTSGTDPQIPATNKRENVTVTFADAANNDFHLDSSDTGAKNQGIILYDSGDDSNLNFTTDIDNEARKDSAGTWDIGADENVAKIYRSVGAGATSPLAWGGTADSSYGNMTISGLIATFWRPLPDNVGVGDALQYDADNTGGIDKIVFITKRIDSTHYSVRKADGTAPDATTSLPNSGWGIYRSYISLSNAEAGTENTGITSGVRDFDAGNLNLTTNNLQWNIACYANGTASDGSVGIDGWTTAVDNYIKIYTPTRTDEVGTSQRHGGVWDLSKYNMAPSDSAVVWVADEYVRFDGIQMYTAGTPTTTRNIFSYAGNTNTNDIRISNCILRGNNNSSYVQVAVSAGNSSYIALKMWNSLIYDINSVISDNNNRAISIYSSTSLYSYIYNVTISGGYYGLNLNNGTAYARNVSILNTTSLDFRQGGGSLNLSYSASEDASAGSSNGNKSSQDFSNTFVDSANGNFHIKVGDSVLRNSGADLTNDSVIPLNTDIDSSGSIDAKSCDSVYQDSCLTRPRSTSWDIGADELITRIYRSVGVGTTAAIISGTNPSISLTISGNTGTFTTWPTSADFGVGDVIRYDSDNNGSLDSTAFISAIDSTAKTATLQNSTGGTAPQMAVADFDWKLYRAYTSLYDWKNGAENTGIGVTYDSGDRDIKTNSEQWNVACYANSGTAPDTTGVSISGWTTAQQNYIKIYTPTLSSEVTTSQRHQGKWDGNKYLISVGSGQVITIQNDFVWIDGIQGDFTGANIGIYSHIDSGATQLKVSNSIIKGGNMGVTSQHSNDKFYIWNNIFYSISSGIYALSPSSWIYNNTFASNANAFNYGGGYTLKNNLFYGNTNDIYNCSAFNGTSDYNATDKASIATGGTYDKVSQTFSFIDSTNKDFHLNSSDTAAKNAGADLSQDLYLPVSSDLDSQTRISNFQLPISNQIPSPNSQYDIGADQSANAIYRSLAPSATGSIASGTSPANSMIIAGTSVTFGTAPGDTIGVGDAIQYDSDNNGSIDSIAFISARTSGTVYTIQDRTGGTPTSTSATDYDWSIFRAYTSLQNATGSSSGGTENAGLSNNIEHFDIDWSASHGKNIYTNNQQWNVSAYANSTTADSTATTISAWTSYPTNYLKIYTPTATTEVGTSQRHQGKYDTSKYRLEMGNTTEVYVQSNYVWLDGLQIKKTASNANYQENINVYLTEYQNNIQISNNILALYGDAARPEQNIYVGGYHSKVYAWNNIMYGAGAYSSSLGAAITVFNNTANVPNTTQIVLYNNTIQSATRGVWGGTASFALAKNNLFYTSDTPISNSTNNWAAGSGYNSTNNSSIGYTVNGGAVGDKVLQTISFQDSPNKDFHLAADDASARNSGADLSDPSTSLGMTITTDIDGHTRNASVNAWDIGADEGATAIYYSVGQSTSTDFKVASNVTVTGYTATFGTAQTGNIGVGDIVTYTGGSCYITGKTSTSIWNCQNATGGTAPQVTGVSVTSIKRAFASLNSSIGGSTAPTFLNTSDLKTNNYILNIPCYMDSGTQPDTTAVTIQGYTTAVPNYIKVYTPNNTTTEANQSQRHQGKWDDSKFHMVFTTNSWMPFTSNQSYTQIIGLQMKLISTSGFIQVINSQYPIIISSNIITGTFSGTSNPAGIMANSIYSYITNNIIYGFSGGGTGYGIYTNLNPNGSYHYNNTITNCTKGIHNSTSGSIAKNNLVYNNTTDYSGEFSSSSTNNLSKDGSAPPYNTYYTGKTVIFADSANSDFHLGIGDTAARNQGINIGTGSTEPNLVVTTDIDGNNRNTDSKGYDIGADEAATPIYYSVGQSSSDLKTGSPTLSIDSSGNGTLSVAQTGNMGVGDYIEYGTSPYTKAYITGKTSSTVWTVQSATGSMLGVGTTMPVNSIKHSYTTLSGAIAGASGATMMNTTDLYTNNYQLNVPCYYDNAADTTALGISGYTTYSTNYIKVYTPTSTTTEANNSQRHSGKWDEGKYRLEVTNSGGMVNYSGGTIIDGLQIKMTLTSSSYNYNCGLMFYSMGTGKEVTVSNNILRGNMSGTIAYANGMRFLWAGKGIGRVYNNVVYDFSNPGYSNSFTGIVEDGGSGWVNYWYNNTVYNNYGGFYNGSGGILKNNIAYNNSNNYDVGANASSTNNLSGPTQTDAPGSNPQNGKTVNFVDSANYDFHLAESDSSARNTGATLTSDSYLPITTDIDGNSRPTQNAFDIGADEGSTYIYYSVGQNTNDHKTGSPTITLSGYQATLSVGQTAPNMGVGDLITYTGGSCYITAKTNDDKMHWNCQNATGGTAPQVSSVSVTSIAHAFSSLNSGINGAHGASYLNATNLYSGNYTLNIPCYYDTGPDTAGVMFDDYTTGASNYIRIYTPTNIATEANQSQRHRGKWDTERYRLEIGGDYYKFDARANYVRIDGLQIKNNDPDARGTQALTLYTASYAPGYASLFVSNNIIWGNATQPTSYYGIALSLGVRQTAFIWNNIIYGFNYNNIGYGIAVMHYNTPNSIAYVYNNTVYGCYRGIHGDSLLGLDFIKNNLSYNNNEYYYNRNGISFNSSSSNNLLGGTTPSEGAWGVSADSGTTTSAASGKLIQSGQNFTQTVKVGMIVKNITDSTYTYVTAIDSDTQLSVATAVPSGKNYIIYTNRYGTVSFANSSNNDYHLSMNDTLAKNQGIKLASYSDDPNLNFQTDIDGNARTGQWSIGADDGPFVEIQQSKNLDMNESLNSGLVGYWSFDGDDMKGVGIGGTALDKSGNGNSGILSGTAPGPSQIEGKRGQALSFDGTNDYIDTSSHIVDGLGAITACSWFKADIADSGEMTMIDEYAGIRLYRHSSEYFGFTVYNTTTDVTAISDSAYADTSWHYVCGVYNGSNVDIYVDAIDVNTDANALTGNIRANASYDFIIGEYLVGPSGFMDGLIDEVRIYNRALNADEVGQLYRMGGDKINSSQEGKYTNGLVGHWTFDQNDMTGIGIGATVSDSSGNNRHGLISGTSPVQTEGRLGQALKFNATNDYINFGTGPSLYGLSQATVSLWYRSSIADDTNWHNLIAQRRSGFNGWEMQRQSDEQFSIRFDTTNNSGLYAVSDSTYKDNNWHHIVGVYNGTQVQAYIDGTAADSSPPAETGTIDVNHGNSRQVCTSKFTGGSDVCSEVTSTSLNGSLDDIRFYNRALSAEEIGDLYNLGKAKIVK